MDETQDIASLMAEIGAKARAASAELAVASAERKHAALIGAAEAVRRRADDILAANVQDMQAAEAQGLSAAMLDRLRLDTDRLRAIEDSLCAIAAQKDPVGEVIAEWDRPTGLHIRRVRMPLGVVGVIYESRPNVTADAAALGLKAGNAVILRAGSEARYSARELAACVAEGLRGAGLPEAAVQLVPVQDRAAVGEMLRMTDNIDVIIPRGGKGLVGLVQREARVPVFAHLEGICHVYVDAAADPEMAERIVMNSKTRRTGICGAAECLLIDRAYYQAHGPHLIRALLDRGVEVRADADLAQILGTVPAGDDDWGCEYLDSIIAARLVDGVDEAIAHIRRYGSQHTDAIVTADDAKAQRFFARLDSAILMRNASTQFADGGEFGMGAEIGIATGRMHARGPVGAEQLTSFKYLVDGDGAVRA